MSRICLMLTLLTLYTPLKGQDDFLIMINSKMDKYERTIANLRKENKRLHNEVNDYRNNNESDKKLENAIQELFASNLRLQEKESELNLLKNNIAFLQSENTALRNKISEMSNLLSSANKENFDKEKRLAESLDKEGKLGIAIRAKDEAMKEVLLNQKNKNKYSGFGVGVGSNYSGLGGSFSFRLGRNQGVGLHLGGGYLRGFLQAESIFVNSGFNFFFSQNWYIDGTYHYNVQHFSGYKYKDMISVACGRNYFFKKPNNLGIKFALGALYADDVIGPEFKAIADLGFMVKF